MDRFQQHGWNLLCPGVPPQPLTGVKNAYPAPWEEFSECGGWGTLLNGNDISAIVQTQTRERSR